MESSAPSGSLRRSSRRATSAEPVASTSKGVADGEEEDADLDEGTRRSSRLRHKPPMKMAVNGEKDRNGDDDDESSTSEEEEDDGDNNEDEDDDDVSTRRNLRPRRTHREPQRFAYEPPVPMRSSSRNRIGGAELRNLDQYSSEDEFQGGRDGGRRRRYNTRENRRPIRRYDASSGRGERRAGREDFRRGGGGGGGSGGGGRRNRDHKKKRVSYRERDTSSSSSSDDPDDARFEKRKAKRMAVERSKLMPLNLGKDDMRKSIFKVIDG